MSAPIYTAAAGTTAIVRGKRGTVVGFTYTANRVKHGALVRLDEEPVMLYVGLGAPVRPCSCLAQLAEVPHAGNCTTRGTGDYAHHEVDEVTVIDRDEFDRLTGLAEARRQMGWTFV